MKKLLITFVLFISCMSDKEMPSPIIMNSPNYDSGKSSIVEGVFINGAHETSGKVKVENVIGGERKLVISDLMTTLNDGKLRIWLSEDLKGSNYELISMMVENGNHTYRMDANLDLAKKPFVLIWCEPANILFGSAELKKPQ